nr:RecName: Full=Amaryllin [Amaryllis belladonna]
QKIQEIDLQTYLQPQ